MKKMKNEKNDDKYCRFEMKWKKNIRWSCVNVIIHIISLQSRVFDQHRQKLKAWNFFESSF
jgi:hypothetical protein